MEARVIKRIIDRKNFGKYNIPQSFGEKAELIIIPFIEENIEADVIPASKHLMEAQEKNGSISILNETEEEAWNDL